VLVQRARRDPRAALSLLALLEPELRSIYRHLVRRGTEPDEAQAVTLGVAWEVVSGHRARRRPSSSSGLSNAIWAEIRCDAGLRRNGAQTVPLPEGFDVPPPADEPAERWPGLLAAAVGAGVITARQAILVAETRVEDRPLAEVAKAVGRPYNAVRMERARAEVALRAFAPSYLSGGGS
jgi:DNA-directed RNA polymerase specialized sigma24 family protein